MLRFFNFDAYAYPPPLVLNEKTIIVQETSNHEWPIFLWNISAIRG
jgi:hypothetical protein